MMNGSQKPGHLSSDSCEMIEETSGIIAGQVSLNLSDIQASLPYIDQLS